MNKYKLIVSDFDGTLAGRDEVISEKVTDAIKKWEESGRHCLRFVNLHRAEGFPRAGPRTRTRLHYFGKSSE